TDKGIGGCEASGLIAYSIYQTWMNFDDISLTGGGQAVALTTFAVTDQTSGSSLVTNSGTVNVTIAADVPGGQTPMYLVTETDAPPAADDPGWTASIATYTIMGGEGDVTLYGWAKDESDNIGGPLTAGILFSTATPVVSNVVITAGGPGTAVVTWDTDIPAEGSVNYGPVSMTGTTPDSAPENALGTSHSVTIDGIAADPGDPHGTNYKIVLVNNEVIASPAYFWPSPWPIDGDANMDCRVNILDLIFIRNKLNQDAGTGDNWMADVNEDNRINILDLIFVRNKLNTQCP
ncbi:MAG TPA: dockerin type I repeat-containing protein, partial [Planctomycetota bacterium]|nr:dockerin type I repeat-containing protein [Planctomycetota bacterium]